MNSTDPCDTDSILCSEEEVFDLLFSLDLNKANGDDNISSHMLKHTAISITEAITRLFNISITLGELPNDWKTSCITPIPKSGDPSDPSNYTHRNLLQKLKSVKLNSYLLRWITHYLCRRLQSVYICINGSSSNKLPVISGVPQGSVLGPILFIIYINDITSVALSDGSMTLLADDIMLYRPTHSVADYALLQHDIDSIASWTDQNFLDFNANKCKYMIISRKLHSSNSHNPLTALMINGTELEQVDSYKHLGVWIMSTLSWSKHVTEFCKTKGWHPL